VLRRSPNFASTHCALGMLVVSTGRYSEAVAQFSAAVKSSPSDVEARLQLADAFTSSSSGGTPLVRNRKGRAFP
jgi:cytochrome c-type biogenesis protein CcmH/NrfG